MIKYRQAYQGLELQLSLSKEILTDGIPRLSCHT